MKILLLANQPERTTRLRMFTGTLQSQGHEVVVPSFGTRNWISIAGQAKRMVMEEKQDWFISFKSGCFNSCFPDCGERATRG